jgi:hypothetical protein
VVLDGDREDNFLGDLAQRFQFFLELGVGIAGNVDDLNGPLDEFLDCEMDTWVRCKRQ